MDPGLRRRLCPGAHPHRPPLADVAGQPLRARRPAGHLRRLCRLRGHAADRGLDGATPGPPRRRLHGGGDHGELEPPDGASGQRPAARVRVPGDGAGAAVDGGGPREAAGRAGGGGRRALSGGGRGHRGGAVGAAARPPGRRSGRGRDVEPGPKANAAGGDGAAVGGDVGADHPRHAALWRARDHRRHPHVPGGWRARDARQRGSPAVPSAAGGAAADGAPHADRRGRRAVDVAAAPALSVGRGHRGRGHGAGPAGPAPGGPPAGGAAACAGLRGGRGPGACGGARGGTVLLCAQPLPAVRVGARPGRAAPGGLRRAGPRHHAGRGPAVAPPRARPAAGGGAAVRHRWAGQQHARPHHQRQGRGRAAVPRDRRAAAVHGGGGLAR